MVHPLDKRYNLVVGKKVFIPGTEVEIPVITDEYVDMLAAGIIDPKKVTRVALENAASVAGMILTTECALIDIKEETPSMPGGMGGGMPGMM